MIMFFNPVTKGVIFVTIFLFGVVIFVQGLTHELLLEAGVILVSVKLIMSSYRNRLN